MEKEKKYVFYTLSSEENINDVRYVGVTTRPLKTRLAHHNYVARNPDKRSTPVSKWIYSLQCKNVKVIISKIDECNENEWENKEKELILKYKIDYNLLNVDEGGKGVITLDKRSKSGIIRSSESHEIKIVQLDLNGKYIKTFDSIMKAAYEMGLSAHSAITNVLKGRSKTSCNSYWIYEHDYINNSFVLKTPITPKDSRGIKYYQYCPNTLKLIKCHLSQADVLYEMLGNRRTNSEALKKSINNKITWLDYFWTIEEINDFSEYFDDRYKLFEINLEGEIINKFKSNIDCAKYFNLADSTISNYIRNKTLTKNNTYLIKNKRIKI